MTFNLSLSPQTHAWLDSEAKFRGTEPEVIIRNIVEDRAALANGNAEPVAISERNKAAIAYLQEQLAEYAKATPEEIQAAEEEYLELQRNLAAKRFNYG